MGETPLYKSLPLSFEGEGKPKRHQKSKIKSQNDKLKSKNTEAKS